MAAECCEASYATSASARLITGRRAAAKALADHRHLGRDAPGQRLRFHLPVVGVGLTDAQHQRWSDGVQEWDLFGHFNEILQQ